MILEPTIAADSLVNLLGAGGALVLARELKRNDPRGGVTTRIVAALRLAAFLFVVRAVAWTTGNGVADALADSAASALPLAALVVAEGLTRRHAPLAIKVALLASPILILVAKTLPVVTVDAVSAVLLASVAGGFGAVVWLLWMRDRDSLTQGENRVIRQMLAALVVLMPLILTDFRSLWPEMPVRLGATGALLLLYVGFGAGNLNAAPGARAATLAMLTTLSLVLAAGYVVVSDGVSGAAIVRVAAVTFTAFLLAVLFAEAMGARTERSRPLTRLLSARTPAEFAERLGRHPILGGAQILDEAALATVMHPALDTLLDAHPTLRRADAPWGRSATDPGVERALSVLTTFEATHLAVLSRSPLRLAAFALPAASADARTEGEIEMARLIGMLVHSAGGRS